MEEKFGKHIPKIVDEPFQFEHDVPLDLDRKFGVINPNRPFDMDIPELGEETVAPLSPPVPVFEKDFGETLVDPPYPEKASFRPPSRPRSTIDYEKLTDDKVVLALTGIGLDEDKARDAVVAMKAQNLKIFWVAP